MCTMLRPRLLAALSIAIALTPVSTIAAEAPFGADAAVLYDSNVTRAQYAADIRRDGAARLASFAGRFFAPTGNDTIDVAAFAQGETVGATADSTTR